jgi:hypothetical protein
MPMTFQAESLNLCLINDVKKRKAMFPLLGYWLRLIAKRF